MAKIVFASKFKRILFKKVFRSRMLDMNLFIAELVIYYLISSARLWNICLDN